MDNTDKYIEILNEKILPHIDYSKLAESYESEDKAYAKGVLKILHNIMKVAYGTDYFDCHGDEEYIVTPAIIQSQKTGTIALALLDIDLSSSGELCGAAFLTEYGIINTSNNSAHETIRDKINERYYPFSYGYTVDISGDIHDDIAAPTKDIKDFLKTYTQHEITLTESFCENDNFVEEEDELDR